MPRCPIRSPVRARSGCGSTPPASTRSRPTSATGTYAYKPPLPYTPGSDAAGVVDAVGDGVTGLAVGDRVYLAGPMNASTGSYAELVGQRARATSTPCRAALSFAQGAAVGVPCSTAWRALFQKAGAMAGETVLVHGGSGAVGTAAIQLARAAGLTVIATAGSAKGLALVTSLGAHHAVDHSQPDYAPRSRRLPAVAARTSSIEMLANVNLAARRRAAGAARPHRRRRQPRRRSSSRRAC